MLYLDNAATSHPKPESVYLAVDQYLRQGGSPSRGAYAQSLAADQLLFETRELLGQLFNVPASERFVFTFNATLAINQALFGLLAPGERVVSTSMEHNAVARPLTALADRGVTVVKVKANPADGSVDQAALKAACLERPTRLLVVNHCSNVFGTLQDIAGLGRWCHENGILFMVDGAQTAGLLPIDISALDIDLFTAPGHKGLLGPQGTGILYVAPDLDLVPLVYGGTGANSHSDRQPEEMPERLESGTYNLPGIAGLKAGLEFILATGVEEIRRRETHLVGRLVTGLKTVSGVRVYGPDDLERRGAAVSFTVTGLDPAEIGFILDQQENIAVRVGLHCAPDAHRSLGTYPGGTVRVSPGYFTTDREIDHFLRVIARLECA